MFNFLKKDSGVPDVGKEDEYELSKSPKVKKTKKEVPVDELEDTVDSAPDAPVDEEDSGENEAKEVKANKNTSPASVMPVSVINESRIESEKLNARLDSIIEWINQFYERFSRLNESIGEVRALTLSNEKRISESSKDANMVIDIVREVKPEELRVDYQKLDIKISTVNEKIEGTKQMIDALMEEVKDLKRRANVFLGTDAILSLNEEVKKDLVSIQQLSGKVKLHADKAEQIFIELKKGFEETQRINSTVANFNSSYSGLKEDVEKIKVDFSEIVLREDFNEFKKTFNNKMALFDESLTELGKIKDEEERLSKLIETTLAISKNNREDLKAISIASGSANTDSVKDYENRMIAMLQLIDSLAGQILILKKKAGIDTKKEKISVESKKPQSVEWNLRNMELNSELSESLNLIKTKTQDNKPVKQKNALKLSPIEEDEVEFKKTSDKNPKKTEKKIISKKEKPAGITEEPEEDEGVEESAEDSEKKNTGGEKTDETEGVEEAASLDETESNKKSILNDLKEEILSEIRKDLNKKKKI